MEKAAINATCSDVVSQHTKNTQSQKRASTQTANKSLKYLAIFWFLSILAGQWFFFYYIITFYGFSVINDNMEIWNRLEPLGSTPYKLGDIAGNVAFAAHAIGAGIVAFGGALQLIPKLRTRFPKLHKINGYVYLLTVFCLAASGFYLVWIRGTSPDLLSATGTSINGFLIFGFAYLTVRCAIKRDIASHRKWALRLFLVSSAQWFLRVGVFSYLISGSVMGLNPGFSDPFFPFWTFGCFVLPLATLQMYFYAKEKGSVRVKYAASATLSVLTILMLVGIIGLTPLLITLVSGDEIAL